MKLLSEPPFNSKALTSSDPHGSSGAVASRAGLFCAALHSDSTRTRRSTANGFTLRVIRLLDGTKAYVHAVIDNFSRRILAWRVADTFAPVNSVAVLVDAGRGATPSETTPVVLADAGVENVNAQVDDLIASGALRRVLAFTELKFSNSMIEAWWRSLKHQWLFLHSLDSVTTVRRLVEFYVHEHNGVLPHSAFRAQTPDEIYFGTGHAVPAELTARAAAARRIRVEANRSAT